MKSSFFTAVHFPEKSLYGLWRFVLTSNFSWFERTTKRLCCLVKIWHFGRYFSVFSVFKEQANLFTQVMPEQLQSINHSRGLAL